MLGLIKYLEPCVKVKSSRACATVPLCSAPLSIQTQHPTALVSCLHVVLISYAPLDMHLQLGSYSQGLLGPEALQRRMHSLQSRLQHLSNSTSLISSEALPQRDVPHNGECCVCVCLSVCNPSSHACTCSAVPSFAQKKFNTVLAPSHSYTVRACL